MVPAAYILMVALLHIHSARLLVTTTCQTFCVVKWFRLTVCVYSSPNLMLAYTPGTAIQALQRLAASNPMLYKALLHMKKDSDGCISAATLVQVSCNAVRKLMHAFELQQSQHTIKILKPANFASAQTSTFIVFAIALYCKLLSRTSPV